MSAADPGRESPLAEELGRRIGALERAGDEHFGAFTTLDWLACAITAVALPALALWWHWP